MKLFFFTETYPYEPYEAPFCESELFEWNKEVSNLYLCPFKLTENAKLIKTPYNVNTPFLKISSIGRDRLKILCSMIPPSHTMLKVFYSDFFARKIYLSKTNFQKWLGAFLKTNHILRSNEFSMFRQLNPNETVLYFYWAKNSAYLIPWFRKHYPQIKIILRCHGIDFVEERSNHYLPLRRAIYNASSFILPVSEWGATYLKENYSPKASIFVSLLGTPPKKELIPIQLEQKHPVLVSCSRLHPVKRVHLIVEALSFFKEPVHWIHFGTGEERTAIENKIKILPSHISVELKGGTPNKDVLDFYETNYITAFINVSSSEGGIPVSIAEAAARGIPTIATDVGGNREIVHSDLLLKENFDPKEVPVLFQKIWHEHKKYSDYAYSECDRKLNALKNARNIVVKMLDIT